MQYLAVSKYLMDTRTQMQDLIPPYRYTDDAVVVALNNAMFELSRLRADMFLDLKYQQRLVKGDINDGTPGLFLSTSPTDVVPIPAKYYTPVIWYMQSWLEFTDVADAQDQRAGAMLQKFQTMCLTLAA